MGYYSGQGRLYVAERNADGTPKGFTPIGNVPNLELAIEVTKFEHTESMSGSRATDQVIIQEKKGTFTMTMEDMKPSNLALALWGQQETVAAGVTVANDNVTAYLNSGSETMGVHIALSYPKVSNVVIKDNATLHKSKKTRYLILDHLFFRSKFHSAEMV